MGVSVEATAPSDGSHLVNGNMTTTVSCSLLIPSRNTTDHSKDMVGMSGGEIHMGLGLAMMDH
jgi:hypothetical protein